jgi:transcriptional regulator with XRE-family HTH domain
MRSDGDPPETAGDEGGGDADDALPDVVVEAVKRRMAWMRLNQKRLAGRLGVTETTVSRWLNRQQGVPLGQLARIAEVLGAPLGALFAETLAPGLLDPAPLHSQMTEANSRLAQVERVLDHLRQSVRAVPLYRPGTLGDPRRGEGDPHGARATSFAHRPPGLEQTVGPRGFAVLVEGDALAGRGLRAGDVVFCNPDAPWSDGSLVAVGLGEPQAEPPAPLALRELAYGPTRALDARTAPEDGAPSTHPAGAYVVYGPLVVALSVALLPEGRGHAEEARRRGPGPSREQQGGTPLQYSGNNGETGNPVTVRP